MTIGFSGYNHLGVTLQGLSNGTSMIQYGQDSLFQMGWNFVEFTIKLWKNMNGLAIQLCLLLGMSETQVHIYLYLKEIYSYTLPAFSTAFSANLSHGLRHDKLIIVTPGHRHWMVVSRAIEWYMFHPKRTWFIESDLALFLKPTPKNAKYN